MGRTKNEGVFEAYITGPFNSSFYRECKIYLLLRLNLMVIIILDIFKKFRYVINKPRCRKTYLRTYAPSKDSDQPTHYEQSDLNLHYADFGQPMMQSFFMRTRKTLVRLQADLSLRLANILEGTFFHVADQILVSTRYHKLQKTIWRGCHGEWLLNPSDYK